MSQTKWDLDLIFPPKLQKDPSTYHKKVEKKAKDFAKKWKKDKSYLTDPAKLKEALDEYEEFSATEGVYTAEGYYYWMAKTLDQSDETIKSRYNQVHEISVELANELEFFMLSLSKIKPAVQKKMLASELLVDYHHLLEEVFKRAKHTLSEKEEQLLNRVSKSAYSNWIDMMQALISKSEKEVIDTDGKKKKLPFEKILNLSTDSNKKIRDYAAERINEIFEENIDVAEHELNNLVELKKSEDKIRSYDFVEESRFLSDEVERETVEALVDVVSDSYDISKKYYEIKAKLLGQKKLEYHERTVEIATEENNKEYSFEEAYEIVNSVFKELNSEFSGFFEEMFEGGKVDVYPKKGKQGGAFCIHVSKSTPIYIMLNFTGKISDITTIAHEFGHAIHSFFSIQNQNSLNIDYSTATAETASTFFEDFVFDRLMEEVDERTKLKMLMSKLDGEVSTIIRQISFFRFEQDLHELIREKGYASKERIGKLFQKHMSSYMGEYVNMSPGSENWWVYVTHFRRFFYVYSYAYGSLVSKALRAMVQDDPKNISKVRDFFSAGGSKSPKDIFLDIGIDISEKSFWEKGVEEVRELLGEVEEQIA